MRRPKPRIGTFAAGLIALLAAAGACYFAFGGSLPGHHFTISAVFRTTDGLAPGSPVRIAGVNVGKVTAVKHVRGNAQAAVVEMQIADAGLPLHDDAVAAIKPRVFLEGNLFVDLEPGSPSAARLGDGGTIPINQTTAPVQLSQVLGTLTSDTRTRLQVALQELARSTKGGGAAAFNRSLPYWAPAYRGAAVVNQALLGERPDDVSTVIRSSGRFAAALDRNPAALQSLIADLRTTAGSFAREQDNLGRAVAELPATLRAATPSMRTLDSAFPPVRALAVEARPGVRAAGPAFSAAIPLLRELDGLMGPAELRGLAADLRAGTPALARLSGKAPALLDQLRLGASCGNRVIVPWSHDKVPDATFPSTGPVYEELAKGLPGVAGESRSGDANGQWIAAMFSAGNYAYPQPGNKFLLSANPIEGANPPPPKQLPSFRPDVPCETQEQPDLRTSVAPPPSGFKVDTTSSTALALQQRAVTASNAWVTGLIKRAGLEGQLKVSDDVLRASQIPQLQKAVPSK